MRLIMVAAVAVALISAVVLYRLSYDTRLVEAGVRKQERAAEEARAAVAILRAERAHLARPDRIEPLARALGLKPVTAAQFASPAGLLPAEESPRADPSPRKGGAFPR